MDSPKPEAQKTPGDKQRRCTVLLVEDNADVRMVLSTTLERQGYTVLAASDGNSAFRMCLERGGGIDLVITDIVLPGINGVDLIELLRAQWPRVRAILLSGQIQKAMLGERNLCVPFLAKPVDPKALLETVRSVLQG